MSYCKYHPLTPAVFNCPSCHIQVCRYCADENQKGNCFDCILCQKKLEAQSITSESCIPFWRRLQESFRYPLNGNSLTLIFAFALISTLVRYLPIFSIGTIIINLFMLGAILKYCFSCLENTSLGDMRAPDITEAYGGGLQTIFHIFAMFIFLGFVIGVVDRIFGQAIAGLATIVLAMGFPAILINYALSASLISSLNLASMFRLISTIGLPYGLLIAFILIMFWSVVAIYGVIGYRFSFISDFLQTAVTWYYMIVTFHIMGYMIFQYQDKLGFVAHSSDDVETTTSQSDEENLQAKINVYLKEGELDKVIDLFERGIVAFPDNDTLLQRYFDFLLRTRSKNNLSNYAPRYLNMLVKRNRFDIISVAYKKIIAVAPEYKPTEPHLRFYIARASLRGGDANLAVKLTRGLHKEHPQFEFLIEAYEVMLEAIRSLPAMQEQLPKCEKLLEHLRALRPQKETLAPKPKKVMFGASDLSNAPENVVEPAITANIVEPDNNSEEPKDLPPIEFKP